MTPSFLRNCACASLLGVSALGLHAAPLTLAGSGTTVDFYFDAGFWGSAPAFTVVGDNIRFDGIGLSAFTPGGTSGGSDRQSFNALPGQAALVAVARAGFDFGGGYSANLGFSGSYALQDDGLVAAVHGADLYAGSFGGGVFGGANLLGSFFAQAGSATLGSGVLDDDAIALTGSAGAGQALALVDLFTVAEVFQDGVGNASATINSLHYTISAARLNAVPEPASWVLVLTLLAGLATARRFQHTSPRTDGSWRAGAANR